MALRKLRLEDDPILRKKSRQVVEVSNNIKTLLEDMKETMDKYNGVGLAAPQVGVLRRVVIIDVGEGVIEMINPEIIEKEGTQCDSEGCLSIPGKSGKVERPAYVKVKYRNRDWEEIELEARELLAVAVCHEVDHLEGILYTDIVLEMDPEETEEDETEQQ